MYTNMPFLVEGEILGVQVSPDAEKTNFIRYFARIDLPDGSSTIVPNVTAGSWFGGIDDYSQMRLRTTTDDGNAYEPDAVDENDNARIGTRVYIAFIGGAMTKPVIVGYAPHPNQTEEFEGADKLKPQAVFKILGMRFDFPDNGAMTVTHYGAPEIKYVKSGGLGAAVAAVGAAAGLLGALSDNPIDPDKENPAVTPQDAEKRTIFGFHDLGGLYVRDSLNQLIDVNTEAGRIYIANNDVQSGPQIATNNTDSEYVLLDRAKELVLINARKTAQIYTFGNRKDVTEKDHSHKILGNEEISIVGNKTDKILGSLSEDVTLDYKQTVSGTYTISTNQTILIDSIGAFSVKTKANVLMEAPTGLTFKSAGATLKLSPAKVALGAGGVEVLKTLSDAMKAQLDTLQAILKMTVGTSSGPSSIPINAAEFSAVVANITALKLKLDLITDSL